MISQRNTDFEGRLVTLCDGRPGLRVGLATEIRQPADPDSPHLPVLDFIASTETLDRFGEIIQARGWQLDAYRRNPVFLNAHQHADILSTLGKALITEVRDDHLFQRVEFAVEANPVARIAYRLYQGRFLNAVSVGFIPLRWENGAPDTGYRRKYLEQELLEVSAVGIPANPDALRLGLKAGAIEKQDLQALLDLLRPLCPARVPPSGGSSRQSPKDVRPHPDSLNHQAQGLLQFARALARLLRKG